MDIFTFEEGKLLVSGTGIMIKEIFASGNIGIKQVLLHTGGKPEKHTEKNEQLYYLTEGKGTMVIKAERKRITEGMLVRCPSGVQRSVINSSSKNLSFLILTAE